MPSRSDLIALLTSYRPSDPDEVEYRTRMLDLAAASLDPFSRHEYAPGHVTASGFVLNPAADRILLIHHERLGLWLQPGGHVEPGDATLLEAASREIAEETGLTGLRPVADMPIDIDVHVFAEAGDQPRHLHFDVRFGFVSATDRVEALDGALAAEWVSSRGLSRLGVDQSILRPAAKLLGVEQEGETP